MNRHFEGLSCSPAQCSVPLSWAPTEKGQAKNGFRFQLIERAIWTVQPNLLGDPLYSSRAALPVASRVYPLGGVLLFVELAGPNYRGCCFGCLIQPGKAFSAQLVNPSSVLVCKGVSGFHCLFVGWCLKETMFGWSVGPFGVWIGGLGIGTPVSCRGQLGTTLPANTLSKPPIRGELGFCWLVLFSLVFCLIGWSCVSFAWCF